MEYLTEIKIDIIQYDEGCEVTFYSEDNIKLYQQTVDFLANLEMDPILNKALWSKIKMLEETISVQEVYNDTCVFFKKEDINYITYLKDLLLSNLQYYIMPNKSRGFSYANLKDLELDSCAAFFKQSDTVNPAQYINLGTHNFFSLFKAYVTICEKMEYLREVNAMFGFLQKKKDFLGLNESD